MWSIISGDTDREGDERGVDGQRGQAGGQNGSGVRAGNAREELALPYADSHFRPQGLEGQ